MGYWDQGDVVVVFVGGRMGWSSSWSWDDDFFSFGGSPLLPLFSGTPGHPGFDFPSRDSSSTNPFVLTRMVLSFSGGGLTRCWLGVWVHPWPEQLASEPILRIGVKRPGFFLLALKGTGSG